MSKSPQIALARHVESTFREASWVKRQTAVLSPQKEAWTKVSPPKKDGAGLQWASAPEPGQISGFMEVFMEGFMEGLMDVYGDLWRFNDD